MGFSQTLNAKQKALAINLDNYIYGSLAEIGAGQEVGRNFFRAGGAAGTIAKTISAYDMTVSDTVYGKSASGRYVSEARLLKMLDREYSQLIERLSAVRDDKTKFFAFADTVAAKSFRGNRECHGWLGVRFQHKAKAKASEVIVHVRMLDKDNLQQQEALGIIGVNLIHACYNHADSTEKLVCALMDGLSTDRLEIDMIRVDGPAFNGIDSRILSLELVKRRFCTAVMFDSDGSVLQATDYLYKKNIVACRGSFRPPTLVNIDMLNTGLANFKEDLEKEEHKSILVLPEISMSKLIERGEVDNDDFLARVDLLGALGHKVLISSFESYHCLNQYLANYSKKKIAFAMGIYNLEEILNEANYENDPEGLLGGVGALLGHTTKLYVYPAGDEEQIDRLKTVECMKLHDSLTFLLMYLLENDFVKDMKGFNPSYSSIWSRTVLRMIQNGEEGWEKMLPTSIAKAVKKKQLFGYGQS
jgi:hypothetical protein